MPEGEITELLVRLADQQGDERKHTYDQIVTLVYSELRRRAQAQLYGERDPSLRPTILVHEAYDRLLGYRMAFHDRNHFYRAAATAMRRYVVERARNRRAVKRGYGQPAVQLEEEGLPSSLSADPDMLLDIDKALGALRPEQVQLTELRFFAGFTVEETAEIMGLKPETVKKRWEIVRARLFQQLRGARNHDS